MTYLEMGDIKHSELIFTKYLQDYGGEICPVKGDILYEDEKVKCNIHDSTVDRDGEVPYL